MSAEAQGDIIVSDGEHKVDVAEHEVPLIRHMIRYDPEIGWNGYSLNQDKTTDHVRNILDGNDRGIGL